MARGWMRILPIYADKAFSADAVVEVIGFLIWLRRLSRCTSMVASGYLCNG